MALTIKQLAKKAKLRLKYAGKMTKENQIKTTRAYMSQGDYRYVILLQEMECDPVYKKIKKFLDEGISFSVRDLKNEREFQSLSTTEKELYMSRLSMKYEDIMEFIENQKKIGQYK